MYTKSDFFRPGRNYTGPHNPEAYQRGIARRKAANAAMAKANRAEQARKDWMTPERAALMAHIKVAAENGNEFAQSLWHAEREWGRLTERQEAAAQRFRPEVAAQARAERFAAAPSVGDANSMAPMFALFDKAAERLRRPGFLFNLAEGDRTIKVDRAGPRSNAPGAINVVDHNSGAYLGRVHLDGKWMAARDYRADTSILAALVAFAADPAGVAAAYGKRTGRCCFCNQALTDGRSTEVGYGETCARNYGLPWGRK